MKTLAQGFTAAEKWLGAQDRPASEAKFSATPADPRWVGSWAGAMSKG